MTRALHLLFVLSSICAIRAQSASLPVFNVSRQGSQSPLEYDAVAASPRFPYGSRQVRGVNIGGWLVLEPWITPSLFDGTGDSRIVDEYTFGQYQSKSTAQSKLKNHWDSFITESDFQQIAAAGLNHVRIPIGFWAFDVSGGEPYIQGQYPYLLKAVQWAKNAGLYVLVDIHGLPGSQNGFDNSGRRGSVRWNTNQDNIDRSIDVVKLLADEFKKSQYANVVSLIGPVNEPAGFSSSDLLTKTRQYYKDSYGNIRSRSGDLGIVLHDAFQPLSYWNNFMASSDGYSNVLMDTHHYEIFSDDQVAMTYPEHINTACQRGDEVASYAKGSGNLWTFVGEWTTTPYDCAKYLNGRGVGARYDGTRSGSTKVGDCSPFTGSTSKFPTYYKTFMRQFFEAQTSSFEQANGWIYWTWKTEATDEWSYSKGLAGGWIPRDPTERKYPNICN